MPHVPPKCLNVLVLNCLNLFCVGTDSWMPRKGIFWISWDDILEFFACVEACWSPGPKFTCFTRTKELSLHALFVQKYKYWRRSWAARFTHKREVHALWAKPAAALVLSLISLSLALFLFLFLSLSLSLSLSLRVCVCVSLSVYIYMIYIVYIHIYVSINIYSIYIV